MDPYLILGIDYNATPEDIKMAYRRVAMRWHPDRNGNSPESRERFHQAATAYRELLERADKAKSRYAGNEARQDQTSDDSDQRDETENDDQQSGDFADSVFWDVTLDYAIKLAQNGMQVNHIRASITRNGCPERLARLIAEKAFDINAHFAADAASKRRHKGEPDQTSFRDERLQGELWRAFIGQRSFVFASRGSVDHYLLVFRSFQQSSSRNPLRYLSPNRRLLQILNFSVVLFVAMLVAVQLFPGESEYKLLADRELLQIPFLVLPLMILWLLYRRLWLAAIGFTLISVGNFFFYHETMPVAPEQALGTTLLVAVIGFTPFLLLAVYANFLYYLKSRRMLGTARALFDEHIDQLVWVKNRGGTSASTALLFLLILVAALVELGPGYWSDSRQATLASTAIKQQNAEKLERLNRQVEEALRLFNIAEAHFNASPPDYREARIAYAGAAENGSLLAAYKLGFLYYSGIGVARDDRKAFRYFREAVRAPLAFQPHELDITTRFLAESYTNLGIHYQAGLGTARDQRLAERMYRRALEFGSVNAANYLNTLYRSTAADERKSIAVPEYR